MRKKIIINIVDCTPLPPLNLFGPDSDIKHIEDCVAGLNHLMIISKPTTSELSFQ